MLVGTHYWKAYNKNEWLCTKPFPCEKATWARFLQDLTETMSHVVAVRGKIWMNVICNSQIMPLCSLQCFITVCFSESSDGTVINLFVQQKNKQSDRLMGLKIQHSQCFMTGYISRREILDGRPASGWILRREVWGQEQVLSNEIWQCADGELQD